MRMGGHAAHGDFLAAMFPPEGQRDVKRGSGGFGIGEEKLVKIAHAEKYQRIRRRGLGGEPLRHGGCGTGGIRNRACWDLGRGHCGKDTGGRRQRQTRGLAHWRKRLQTARNKT